MKILTQSLDNIGKSAPLANSFILCYCYSKNKSYMPSPEKTVLIIEDEADAAELFAEMMRVSGFRVRKTSSSTPAIDMMIDEKPDVVLLDIMMPEVSGLDILRKMRRDPALANIPVVVVSAKSMPADIKIGMDAGASIYLTKPVGFLELKEAVERVLGSQSAAA
jgi:CheY-like chemotaxis protein